MTQEEKFLLLKHLCGSLPYVTYVRIVEADCLEKSESITEGCVGGYSNTRMCQDYSMDEIFEFIESGDTVKPYLRPLGSMTEEEERELSKKYVWDINCGQIEIRYHSEGYWDDNIECPTSEYLNLFDWLNAHHFDYRGLIPMGLAIEAPEGMYKFGEMSNFVEHFIDLTE